MLWVPYSSQPPLQWMCSKCHSPSEQPKFPTSTFPRTLGDPKPRAASQCSNHHHSSNSNQATQNNPITPKSPTANKKTKPKTRENYQCMTCKPSRWKQGFQCHKCRLWAHNSVRCARISNIRPRTGCVPTATQRTTSFQHKTPATHTQYPRDYQSRHSPHRTTPTQNHQNSRNRPSQHNQPPKRVLSLHYVLFITL